MRARIWLALVSQNEAITWRQNVKINAKSTNGVWILFETRYYARSLTLYGFSSCTLINSYVYVILCAAFVERFVANCTRWIYILAILQLNLTLTFNIAAFSELETTCGWSSSRVELSFSNTWNTDKVTCKFLVSDLSNQTIARLSYKFPATGFSHQRAMSSVRQCCLFRSINHMKSSSISAENEVHEVLWVEESCYKYSGLH